MLFNKMQRAIIPHLEKAHAHPFNTKLSNGTLPNTVFKAFIEQDRLYYIDFSQALELIAARSAHQYHQQLFHKLSNDIHHTQMNLHHKYLIKCQSQAFFQPGHLATNKNPQVLQYTQYLLETANTAPVSVAMASILPCFFIYSDLGKRMKSSVQENNPYQRWIDSYSSEKFLSSTRDIINIMDESPFVEEENMIAAFVKSAEFELSFWDSVYEESSCKTLTEAELLAQCKNFI